MQLVESWIIMRMQTERRTQQGQTVMHMALKKNLDVTIHEAFLEEILQGNWKPGQALNLDELAERYGVSRTPIQQALKRMHTQGMVVFSSKGHFSVPTFSEK